MQLTTTAASPQFLAKLNTGIDHLARAIRGTDVAFDAAKYNVMQGRNDLVDAVDQLGAGVSPTNLATLNRALDILDVTSNASPTYTAANAPKTHAELVALITPAFHMANTVREFESRPPAPDGATPRGVSS